MILPINVIHVPKTAGTSLREGLISQLGSERIICDYGLHSDDTSELIRRIRSNRMKLSELRDELHAAPKVLIGHFPASRYVKIFPARQMLCFLREPVDRMFSDYHHTVRHKSAGTDFIEFVSAKKMRNHVSFYLRGVSWPALGLVGISEQYEESLQVFNELYEAELRPHHENRAPLKHSVLARRSKRRREVIERLNRKDIAIYRAAQKYFLIRLDARKAAHEFVHGCFDVVGSTVSGYAFKWSQSEGSKPLKILIRRGKEILHELFADRLVAELDNMSGIPRQRCVGFRVEFEGRTDLTKLEVLAADSLQPLLRLSQGLRVV